MAFIFMILLVTIASAVAQDGSGGYSYNRFSGPVSGQIQQIKVEPPHGQAAQHHADYGYDHKTGQINPETQKYAHYKTVDYVAKPDYQYAYGVEDPHTGNTQNHKETRDGDVVRGEYSLVEADGTIRRVKYTADSKNGFQAVVEMEPSNGAAPHQEQQQQQQPIYYGNNQHNNQYNQQNDYIQPQNNYKRNNYNGNNKNYNDNRNNYNNENQYQGYSEEKDYY